MASGGEPTLLPHGATRSDLEAGPGTARWQLEHTPSRSYSLGLQNSGGSWAAHFASLLLPGYSVPTPTTV